MGALTLILQNIVFPKYGICSVHDMYFRLDNPLDYSYDNQSINLDNGNKVCFDTYLNGFYLDKWKRYTNIGKIKLTLELKGRFRVSLFHRERLVDRQYRNTILDEIVLSSENREAFTLSLVDFQSGMYSFELLSLKDNSIVFSGHYSSDVSQDLIRDVKLGICICTFKREQYVISNINRVIKSLLEDKNSILSENLEVYISDNGGTLNPDTIKNPHVYLFDNKNVGGAGGFTRCLIEILKKDSGITHAILMDDDIVFDTESIIRTFTVLSLLKEEYRDAFIGGAMLSLDRQSVQIESGAQWNKGNIISLKQGLDLTSCEACLYNDFEETADYNAWWYCAIPIGKVIENGLPLPLFFRGDDSEYGLRNMSTLILMNGICVWHEPFENKYSSTTSYYIFRNRLINNSVHKIDYTKNQLIKDFIRQWALEMARFRYKNASLMVKGIEDYLKGIEWLKSTDGADLHKDIMSLGYRLESIDDLDADFKYPDFDKSLNDISRPINCVLNLLLPSKRNATVAAYNPPKQAFNRANMILNYDYSSRKAFITNKDFRRALSEFKKTLILIRQINKNYDEVKSKYGKDRDDITNSSFWKEYLNLE